MGEEGWGEGVVIRTIITLTLNLSLTITLTGRHRTVPDGSGQFPGDFGRLQRAPDGF